jgi:sec-independent protein translocase protein TatC
MESDELMARQSNQAQEKTATFMEHLSELRRRIIVVLSVFALAVVVGFLVADPIIHYLKQAMPARDIEWNVFSPWDSLRIYMNVALVVAAVLTLPVLFYQLWAFVKPGLREEERRASLMYVPGAFVLSLIGMAFGYFVLFPMAFRFTVFLSGTMGLVETYGAAQYFSFMFNIVLPLGVVFELPVAVMFLTRLRILQPRFMRRMRKYAYFFLFVVSAIITPPDVITAILVCIPLVLLYEFSLMLSRIVHRKQQEADRKLEEMLSQPT